MPTKKSFVIIGSALWLGALCGMDTEKTAHCIWNEQAKWITRDDAKGKFPIKDAYVRAVKSGVVTPEQNKAVKNLLYAWVVKEFHTREAAKGMEHTMSKEMLMRNPTLITYYMKHKEECCHLHLRLVIPADDGVCSIM